MASQHDHPSAAGPDTLRQFLRTELAPFPGRLDAVLQYAVCITLAMLIAFYLQVPFLDLAVIIIFFTVMENSLLTRLVAVIIIACSLVIGVVNNVFLALTIDDPLLRILLSSFLVFVGMYLLRAGPLIGVLGYMMALCNIFLQSNMPLLPNGELMLRLNLWSSVVSVYPAALALVVATLVRPNLPSRLLPDAMAAQLRTVARILGGGKETVLTANDVERDLARLHRLLDMAALERKDIKRQKTRYLVQINTIDRLYIAAARLSRSGLLADAGPSAQEAAESLRAACLAFARAVERGEPFRLPETFGFSLEADGARPGSAGLAGPSDLSAPDLRAELREMRDALETLSSAADADYPPFEGPGMPLLRPDAATNPAYTRFAAKTVLATLICLGFYKTVQWEGIHTCMLTCIIVAQPSLGAIAQKSLLRVSGCLIGSAVTLLIALFIIPYIEDVTWFILISLAVLLPAAWVAVGSARSNYAGMQIAFAYALAMMGASGPTINLTEIRDRLIGILVGVTVSTLVHTLIWPEKEHIPLRRSMASLLRSLAAMVESAATSRSARDDPAQKPDIPRDMESKAWSQLAECRAILVRVNLEPGRTERERAFAARARRWLGEAQDMLFALHALLAARAAPPPELAATLRAQADALGAEASSDDAHPPDLPGLPSLSFPTPMKERTV